MKYTDVPPVQKVIFPHPRKSQEVLPLLIQVHRYASPTNAHHFEARTGLARVSLSIFSRIVSRVIQL